MNERELTVKLMAQIQSDLRGAVVLKHADRFTKFIPDVEILFADRASWIENKLQRRGDRLQDIVEMGQLVLGHQLSTTCGGRSWVVVYQEHPRQITIWKPQVLACTLWPKVVGPLVVPAEPYDIPQGWMTSGIVNLHRRMIDKGVIRCDGWLHEFPSRLLRDALATGV